MTTSHNPPNRLFVMERLAYLTIYQPDEMSDARQSIPAARENANATLSIGPITVGAGGTIQPSILSPDDIDWNIEYAEFTVSNAAGTQMICVGLPDDLDVEAATAEQKLPFAGIVTVGGNGSDLTVENDGQGKARIKSTAGGVFFATFWVRAGEYGNPDA